MATTIGQQPASARLARWASARCSRRSTRKRAAASTRSVTCPTPHSRCRPGARRGTCGCSSGTWCATWIGCWSTSLNPRRTPRPPTRWGIGGRTNSAGRRPADHGERRRGRGSLPDPGPPRRRVRRHASSLPGAGRRRGPARVLRTRLTTIRLDGFVTTRVFEYGVHGLDLAAALGRPPWLTSGAASVVLRSRRAARRGPVAGARLVRPHVHRDRDREASADRGRTLGARRACRRLPAPLG